MCCAQAAAQDSEVCLGAACFESALLLTAATFAMGLVGVALNIRADHASLAVNEPGEDYPEL